MTNLKEGQRIDVYEVVNTENECDRKYIGKHMIQSHDLDKQDLAELTKDGYVSIHETDTCDWTPRKSDVKVIGTFIVKSLK